MKYKYFKNRIKLCSVTIGGYKSIAYDFPITLNLHDVNILLGANGAGKSNIISFFRMLSYITSGSFARYVEISGTANSLLHYGAKKTPAIIAKLQFANEKHRDTYSFTLSNAAPDRLIFTEETIEWYKKGEQSPFIFQPDLNFRESALADSKNSVVKAIFRMLSFCKVYQFNDSSIEGPLRQACPIETANYLQSHGNNLPSFLLFLRSHFNDSYTRIVSYIRDVVPQFQDFYLEPIGDFISLRWIDNSASDYRFNVHQLSDGSIRFIALATLLLQPQETMPEVIILDEPELGLHPYAINQLAEMIKDAALHSQIIIASQSKDLADHFSLDNIAIVEMNHIGQYTTISNLNEDDYREWLKEYTVSELWDKNVIGGQPL